MANQLSCPVLVICWVSPSAKEYNPYSFSKEVAWLDELNKMLTEAKQRLAEASSESKLLYQIADVYGRAGHHTSPFQTWPTCSSQSAAECGFGNTTGPTYGRQPWPACAGL